LGASRDHCDALLAAGALKDLLALANPDTPAELHNEVFPALRPLMDLRHSAAAVSALTHLAALVVDSSVPLAPPGRSDEDMYERPQLVVCCLMTLSGMLAASNQEDGPHWLHLFFCVAPNLPQRLVELLANAEPDVNQAALHLIFQLFRAPGTQQQQQMFECGLIDRLLPLLGKEVRAIDRDLGPWLCGNAAHWKSFALLLVDSAPLIRRLLELLSDSTLSGSVEQRYAMFFRVVFGHRDRLMAHRLVEYGALPPLITALHCARDAGNRALGRPGYLNWNSSDAGSGRRGCASESEGRSLRPRARLAGHLPTHRADEGQRPPGCG